MAEKYPSRRLPEQRTASRDQSKRMGDRHGQLADHTDPDPFQMQITDRVSALQCSQPIGMQNISQADIRLITHKAQLRKAELDNVFEQLEISAADIDNGRRNADTTDFKLQSSAILRAWAMKKAKNATRNKVIEALRECDLTDAAEFLVEVFSESVNSDMKESATAFDLHECQEELRAYYLDEMGKVNMLPWMPEENIEMNSIFVDIDLVRKERSEASQNIGSNEHLVSLKTNQGQTINRVLLTGDAGSGKSTTASNLAYKWALNETQSLLSKFSLVFLIRMKDIEDSNSSLVDLIFENILSEDSNVSKDGLSTYVKENTKDVLFVIDGMDEDGSGALKNKSSGITKLLHNREMRKSCVILTYRPDSISDLGMYVRHYTQVKLEGFSMENIGMFILKFFRHDKEKTALLSTQLIAEPHIRALAKVPVLLLMICMLWEDQRTTPKTKTLLYQKTIRYLWRRYKTRMDEDSVLDEGSDNHEFDDELEDLLKKLGEVALNNTSINGGKITFNENEFGRDVCDLGCQVGLLKRERSRAGLEKKTSVAFLHATFQYFCGAFYLVYLLDTGQKKLDDFDGVLFSFTELTFTKYAQYTIDFSCGIQPEVTIAFLQIRSDSEVQMARKISNPFEVDISIHLRHIFESQLSYQQCSNLIPLFSSYSPKIHLTDDLIPSILYMLELYKYSVTPTGFLSTIKTLTVKTGYTPWLLTLLKHTNKLNGCTVVLGDSNIMNDFDKIYKAISELPNIQQLVLSNYCELAYPLIRPDATNLLISLTKKKVKLTGFELFRFQFDEKVMVRYLSSTSTSMLILRLGGTPDSRGQFAAISNVIDILSRLEHLSHLELAQFQIHSAIKHLRPIIPRLKGLGLIECCLHEKHLKELFSFLSRAQQLKALDLSCNLLSIVSVQDLVDRLKTIPDLETLILQKTGLNDESAYILARFVRGKRSIIGICLGSNPDIGQAGKDALRGLPLTRWVSGPFEEKYENIDTV